MKLPALLTVLPLAVTGCTVPLIPGTSAPTGYSVAASGLQTGAHFQGSPFPLFFTVTNRGRPVSDLVLVVHAYGRWTPGGVTGTLRTDGSHAHLIPRPASRSGGRTFTWEFGPLPSGAREQIRLMVYGAHRTQVGIDYALYDGLQIKPSRLLAQSNFMGMPP